MYLYIGISVVIIWYIIMKWKTRKYYKLATQLKNNLTCLPLVGHAWPLINVDDEERMTVFKQFGEASYKTGGLTSIWLGHRFFLHIADPPTLDVVLKNCLQKDDIMFIEHDLSGNGSVFAPVNIWRPRRKIIAPIFGIKNLNKIVEVFSEQSSVMVEQLKAEAGKGTFALWKYLTTYTMDSICETTLGIKMNAQRNRDQPFLDAFENHCQMLAARICLPEIAQQIYKYLPIYKVYMKHIHFMWDFVDKLVKNKREEIKTKEVKIKAKGTIKSSEDNRKSFIELCIEASGGDSGFTNLELREEILVLLLAGTDTSAVGTAFTCLMLSRHPEVQDKVFAEIQAVFGDSDRPLTSEDLPRFKYLEIVIKESIRLYPPVPIILRKSEKDIMLPNGLEMPKDTGIIINIWAAHRNPEYWGADAEEFKPERFLNNELKHPAAFIPFSYGPRSCVGYKYAMMSMKTSVATLVRHYRLSSDNLNQSHLRVKFDIMMKNVENFELQLEARS